MTAMRGVFLPGNRTLEIREVPVPDPGAGQVLVRMRAFRQLAESLGIGVVEGDEAALAEWTGGKGFEVAIDCSGNAEARLLALRSARAWGRVAFVDEGGTVSFDVSPVMIHPQLTVVGSWVCSIGQMEELVELLVRWDLHPEAMVTDRFGLEEAEAAYRRADAGTAGKVAITW